MIARTRGKNVAEPSALVAKKDATSAPKLARCLCLANTPSFVEWDAATSAKEFARSPNLGNTSAFVARGTAVSNKIRTWSKPYEYLNVCRERFCNVSNKICAWSKPCKYVNVYSKRNYHVSAQIGTWSKSHEYLDLYRERSRHVAKFATNTKDLVNTCDLVINTNQLARNVSKLQKNPLQPINCQNSIQATKETLSSPNLTRKLPRSPKAWSNSFRGSQKGPTTYQKTPGSGNWLSIMNKEPIQHFDRDSIGGTSINSFRTDSLFPRRFIQETGL